MPTYQTHYQMLLSCPSDLNKYYKLIKERMDAINKILSSAYSSHIDVVHWTEDTYPASGDNPQNIINEQIVRDSDFLVSMFWTKFGSPTEKYDSGTEEEIIQAISEKKQVFLYFSNEAIPPSIFDNNEYEKIKKFRDRISDKAYYNTFNSESEFLDKLQIHIMGYFDDLRKQADIKVKDSKLKIMSNQDGKPVEEYHLVEFSNTKNVLAKREKEIKTLIGEVDDMTRLQTIEKSSSDNSSSFVSVPSAANFLQSNYHIENVEIDKEDKEIVNDLAYKLDKKLDDNFFELDGLKKRSYENLIGGGKRYEYIGSTESRKKIKKLHEIIDKIHIYNAEKNFFIGLNTHKYLSLCLTNYKGNYESDIDIKLYFPKGVLYSLEDIPFPGNEIIEIYEELPEQIFKPTTSSSIKEYPEYQFQPMLPHITSIYGNNKNITRDKYERNIRELEEYRIYSEEKFDVLEVDYSEIKPNIALNFPSLIAIKMNGDENLVINYSINTRDSSDIIEGEITISS